MLKHRIALISAIIASSFPIASRAFFNFCFPISSVILIFALAWPGVILYEVFDIQISTILITIIGFILDAAIFYLIGLIIDRKRSDVGKSWRSKYRYKLPVIFVCACVLLFAFAFIDPTCA